jgi:hypothetical protein
VAERLPKGLRITQGKSQVGPEAFGIRRIEPLGLKSPKDGLPKTVPMRRHHVAEVLRWNRAKSYDQVCIGRM